MLENEGAKALWVELFDCKVSSKLIVGVTKLLMQIEIASCLGNVMIMGDFSYPDIDWSNSTARTINENKFINLLHDRLLRRQPNKMLYWI